MKNTDKIIIDDASGKGVIPYLPLPELKKRSSSNQSGEVRCGLEQSQSLL